MNFLQQYKLTILAVALTIAGGAIFLQGPVWLALTLGVIAYGLAAKEFSQTVSKFQSVIIMGIALSVGAGLDMQTETSVPYFLITMLVGGGIAMLRQLLVKQIGYSGYAGTEIVLAVISLACYVGANLMTSLGWMGWVFPAPILLFNYIVGIIDDLLGWAYQKHPHRSDVVTEGDPAPDVALKDHKGETVRLKDFLPGNNILIFFMRLDWCPACRVMLRSYRKNQEKFKEQDVVVLAVSPADVETNQKMVGQLRLSYKVLSDPDLEAAKAFKVFAKESLPIDGPEDKIPPTVPSSFLIDKEGIIRYVARPDKVGTYIDPDSVVPVLESLEQKN